MFGGASTAKWLSVGAIAAVGALGAALAFPVDGSTRKSNSSGKYGMILVGINSTILPRK